MALAAAEGSGSRVCWVAPSLPARATLSTKLLVGTSVNRSTGTSTGSRLHMLKPAASRTASRAALCSGLTTIHPLLRFTRDNGSQPLLHVLDDLGARPEAERVLVQDLDVKRLLDAEHKFQVAERRPGWR